MNSTTRGPTDRRTAILAAVVLVSVAAGAGVGYAAARVFAPADGVPVGSIVPGNARVPAATRIQMLGAETRWSGNNPEADDVARRAQNWWRFGGFDPWVRLELTPSYSGTLRGDSLSRYRASVQRVILTIIFDAATIDGRWQCEGAEGQARFLTMFLDALVSPWASPLPDLPEYLGATARVVIADTSGRVIAVGSRQTASPADVVLQLRLGARPMQAACSG